MARSSSSRVGAMRQVSEKAIGEANVPNSATHRPKNIIKTKCEPVVFVMDVVRDVFEVLHVRPDDHVAQGKEVAMADIVHLHDTPGVLTPAH